MRLSDAQLAIGVQVVQEQSVVSKTVHPAIGLHVVQVHAFGVKVWHLGNAHAVQVAVVPVPTSWKPLLHVWHEQSLRLYVPQPVTPVHAVHVHVFVV